MSAFEEEAEDISLGVHNTTPSTIMRLKLDIIKALESAHAKGRKEGLEEAAKIADDYMVQIKDANGIVLVQLRGSDVAAKIREKINQQEKP